MRITIIAGTNRKKSRTLQLTQYVHSCYAALGVDVTLLDLSTLPPSIFTPEAYGNKPSEFESFSDAVLSANGLVTVTPEYNGSFPGVLKLFIDMLPFPESFEGRPVAFIGLSSGRYGALRSVEQLQMIFGYRNAHIFPKRLFIPSIHSEIQPDGSLATAGYNDRINAQASEFVEFCGRFG